MPTSNPRVNVTVSRQQYELLTRLSKAQGRSRSSVLIDLLETVTPVLERVVVAVEAAQRAQVQATEGLRDSVERAEAKILPHVQAAMGQLDMLVAQAQEHSQARYEPPGAASAVGAGRPSRSRRRRKGPRPVTRGSGGTRKRGAR